MYDFTMELTVWTSLSEYPLAHFLTAWLTKPTTSCAGAVVLFVSL